MIDPYVLIANVLEHFARKFTKLVALSMNKMTEVSTSATSRSVEVPTGHGSIVTSFDELVWVWEGTC